MLNQIKENISNSLKEFIENTYLKTEEEKIENIIAGSKSALDNIIKDEKEIKESKNYRIKHFKPTYLWRKLIHISENPSKSEDYYNELISYIKEYISNYYNELQKLNIVKDNPDLLKVVIDEYVDELCNPYIYKIEDVITLDDLKTFRKANGIIPDDDFQIDNKIYAYIVSKIAKHIKDDTVKNYINKNDRVNSKEFLNNNINEDLQQLILELNNVRKEKEILTKREAELESKISVLTDKTSKTVRTR